MPCLPSFLNKVPALALAFELISTLPSIQQDIADSWSVSLAADEFRIAHGRRTLGQSKGDSRAKASDLRKLDSSLAMIQVKHKF